MRSSSWARARSKKALLTSISVQTRSFVLGAERMLSRMSNSARGAVRAGPRSGGSSGFLVGGQRVAGSSILPTRRRPQSHRSPKGGQEIPKYPTRQSGRGQLVKGIRH